MTGDIFFVTYSASGTRTNYDAHSYYGIEMGSGFVDALLAPPSMKEYIESDCRLEDGKTIITDSDVVKVDSRDLTLSFVIKADTEAQLITYRKNFYDLLAGGTLNIYVPALGTEVYRLVYNKSTAYAGSYHRNICTVTVKFTEPDPTNR